MDIVEKRLFLQLQSKWKNLSKFSADFTHQPATQLAEMLISILPKNLKKVFYSDNGSTSVEVAMKIAIQYWYNIGKKKKKKFVSMKGGYHGDTFGAMSVGFSSGFYKPFEDVLEKQFFTSYPEIWNGKNDIESIEKKALYDSDDILNKYGGEIAALIIEPIIQGAAGMRICRKEFLDKFLQKFKDAGIIIIFDEVMTGFGRSGKMFASDYLSVKQDIMCLA